MITLQKINGSEIIVNADLIETVEKTPDTIITLINGKKMVVSNTPEEIIDLVISFKKRAMPSYQK